jgi:hypothetical protein
MTPFPSRLSRVALTGVFVWAGPQVQAITAGAPLINAAGKSYFTGRSDAFGAGSSTNPNDARFDPEAVRVSRDGKSVFVSDEYGPCVYQFDRATGQRIRSFALPDTSAISHKNAQAAVEIASNSSSGRVTNKGMEGLAITPDGTSLVGEAPSKTFFLGTREPCADAGGAGRDRVHGAASALNPPLAGARGAAVVRRAVIGRPSRVARVPSLHQL